MTRALMVIADIGGYTRFMSVHRINLAHAQYVVAQLLEAVIDGAKGLKLAKLEGDAAFFYATLPDEGPPPLDKLTRAIAEIRNRFLVRQGELVIDRVCTCDGCTQAGDLKLKFVSHLGEIAFQRIKGMTELAGVDVILVHRLLKNAVPLREYVLMSEPVAEHLSAELRDRVAPLDEDLEGIGLTHTFYLELDVVSAQRPPDLTPSLVRRWLGWLKMTLRSIPYFLGIKKSCDGFRNLGEIAGPALFDGSGPKGPEPTLPQSVPGNSLTVASLPPPSDVVPPPKK